MFERALARNIARAVKPWAEIAVKREQGRLTFPLADVAAESMAEVLAAVARLPGIARTSAAIRTEPTIDALTAAVLPLAAERTGTFKIIARRSEKTLPFDSMDVARQLGAAVVEATGRPVDVHTPETAYFVEVDSKRGYVHDARSSGPGGLPTGSNGKVVALLSGGLDSPVAAYRMMLRGCEVIALHLWNQSYSGDGVHEKVRGLAEILSGYQKPLRLEMVPFDEIQQEIIAQAPAQLRMLLYRRAMLRVAELLRTEQKALGTVVGDSVGQVASQTLPNLAAVYDAATPPILAPLSGSNKLDVIAMAKQIGTYEQSIKPGLDCCSLLVPKHPATATSVGRLRAAEEHYDVDALAAEALSRREVHIFPPRKPRIRPV